MAVSVEGDGLPEKKQRGASTRSVVRTVLQSETCAQCHLERVVTRYDFSFLLRVGVGYMCVPYFHSLNTPHSLLVGAQRHSDLGVGGWVRGIVSGKAEQGGLSGHVESHAWCASMTSPRLGPRDCEDLRRCIPGALGSVV